MSLHYSPTPDNPYAWDVDPAELVELRPYERIYLEIVRVVIVNFLRVSGLVSLLFLYLVIRRTRGEMRGYRPIFLICAMTDIIFYIGNTLVEFKAKAADGVIMLKIEGPLSWFSWHIQTIGVGVYLVILALAILTLPSLFYFRYYTFTSERRMSRRRMAILFSFSYFVGIPIGIFGYYAYGYSASIRPDFNYGTLWFPERPLPTVIYADIRHPWQKLFYATASSLITFFYMIVLFIGYKTIIAFNTNTVGGTKKTRSTQNQVTSFLIVQSVIPLFVSSGPNTFLIIVSFFHLDPGIFLTICVDFMGLIPVCNPIISILIIRPYRQAICRVFRKKKIRRNSAFTTSMTTRSSG